METDLNQNTKDPLGNTDFSIVLGGPFFQLLRRLKLSGSSLESPRLRSLALALAAWLPLLFLALLSGKAMHGTCTVPFFEDFGVHIRFLIAVPLMVAAELLIHKRMRELVNEFLTRKLIAKEALDKFREAVNSAMRWRNSFFAEFFIIAFVYVVGIHFIWRPYTNLETSTWYTQLTNNENSLSLAGIWYGYFSIPIFQFLLLRWYYRIFIWTRFIWQVTRMKLNLNPLHPDKVGGLGFLTELIPAFLPLALMHGTTIAGIMADRIYHVGAKLTDFKVELIVMVVLVWCLVLLPLFLFAPNLVSTKRKGIKLYGELGSRYVQQFEKKWMREPSDEQETLLGSGDIQSLADLGGSYENITQMKFSPVDKESLILLGVMTLAPIAPLLLTMMPLEELLKTVMGIFV